MAIEQLIQPDDPHKLNIYQENCRIFNPKSLINPDNDN